MVTPRIPVPEGMTPGKMGMRGKIKRQRPLSERLREKLVVNPETGCHEFTGFRDAKGYGRIGKGKDEEGITLAHRAAWEEANGPIPDGMNVLHRCDNPPCCNEEHLFLGSIADNNEDMRSKGRASGNKKRGLDHHACKTTEEMEARIRAATGSQRQLAAQFGVSRSVIKRVRG